MTQKADMIGGRPPPVVLARTFHAPPATLFRAWGAAEHVRNWFAPVGYTVADAVVDMRVGGAFHVCMRAPDGTEHWTRGTFVDVTPHSRLVIDMHVPGPDGDELFRAYTEIDFADALGGTEMSVRQTYTVRDPAIAGPMVAGAPEGWRTTLDKLEEVVARLRGGAGPIERSVAHGVFHIERTYTAPVEMVWRALTDPAAKEKWFAGTPGDWELLERSMDVRPGGKERLKGRWHGGTVTTFDATYFDVIANARLVYGYEMHLDDRKISVSLATMEVSAQGAGTRLKVTEQGAFLDGYDDAGSREHGTGSLLDRLGESLGT